MRKLIIGLALLASIFFVSLTSARLLDRNISNIVEDISLASELAFEGDNNEALKILKKAMTKWDGISAYGAIFMSQTKIDAVSDALYSYMSIISEGKENPVYKKAALIYHLENIVSHEKISLGSIF